MRREGLQGAPGPPSLHGPPAGTTSPPNNWWHVRGGTYAGNLSTAWGNVIFAPQAIVKNTFVDVVEAPSEEDRFLRRRSASESDISKSSSEIDSSLHDAGYWLPSLSSTDSGGTSGEGPGLVESPPWLLNHMESLARREQKGQIGDGSGEGREAANKSHSPPPCSRDMMLGGPAGAVRPVAPENLLPYTPHVAKPDAKEASQPKGSSHSWIRMLTSSEAKLSQRHTGEVDANASNAERELLVQSAHDELANLVSIDKLRELARSGVLELIPRDEEGRLTSVGSIEHGTKCTPCAYWFKGICKYSLRCHYCHYVHDGQKSKRLRPSKQTRMRIRKWTNQTRQKGDEAPKENDPEDDPGCEDSFPSEEAQEEPVAAVRVRQIERL